jgi:hypothetical protein
LAGAAVAESNPQAGFTRHPTAFVRGHAASVVEYPTRIGRLDRLDDPGVGRDGDFYTVRPLGPEVGDAAFLEQFAVWDCPDLTTKDASYYELRAVEIAALADVGVYVASDERYNDLWPTHFLQAMLDAGKPVIAVLTKASPLDADSLVELFDKQVKPNLRRAENLVGVYCVPAPGRARMNEIWTDAFPHAQALRQLIRQAARDRAVLRRRSTLEARRYLRERQGRLLDPARKDVGEWRAWTEQVRLAAGDAVSRYEREHLSRLDYPEFREAAERLERAFAPSPPLDVLWRILEVLRLPIRWLASQALRAPTLGSRPLATDAALDRVRRGLAEQLHVAVAARRGRHRLWSELHAMLDRHLKSDVEPAFREIRDRQRSAFDEKLREVTGAAADLLTRRPGFAHLLQYGRLTLEVFLLVWIGYHTIQAGYSILLWLVFFPLAIGGLDLAVRLACRLFVDRYREEIVRRQKEDVRTAIQAGYLDRLVKLPPEAGAKLQALAAAADRLPALLAEPALGAAA